MIKPVATVLIFVGIFTYTINLSEAITFSNVFGSLAFSVAASSIAFFSIFSPYGMRSHTTVFGRAQKYRHPVAEIPTKIALKILAVIVACCFISFIFYVYGM